MDKVSVSIMTLNEEEMLPRCLAAVSWADEIVVVDSGSTDRTVDIAREAGARVLHHQFAGYASQCNWGFEQVSGDWVLMVDADEIVEPELRESILRTLAEGPRHDVYEVVRDAVFLGRRMRASSWSNERLPRFFRKGRLRFSGLVHPAPEYEGAAGLLAGKLAHHTYRSLEQYFAKLQSYSTLWARNEFARGKTVGLPYCFLTSFWRFFHNYLLRGEILDGRYGVLASGLSVVYTFVKYVKLWGLTQKSRGAFDAGAARGEAGESGRE